MSARSNSETQSHSSQVSCGQQTPLVAILTISDSYFQLPSVDAAIAAYSIDLSNYAIALSGHHAEVSALRESPQNNIPLENLSVLRI